MDKNKNFEQREVPQINPKTGVSMDYANQINGLVSFYHMGIEEMKAMLKEFPPHIKKYEEVYAGYRNVITDKNRDSIKKLDELATKLSDILKNTDNINEDDFRKTCSDMYFLIYGDNSKDLL